MSKMCGDTARYNRLRKHRIKMRAVVRAIRVESELKKAEEAAKPAKS